MNFWSENDQQIHIRRLIKCVLQGNPSSLKQKVTQMLIHTNTMTNSDLFQTADTNLHFKVDGCVPQTRTVNLRKVPNRTARDGEPRKALRGLPGARSWSRLLDLGYSSWACIAKIQHTFGSMIFD